jgi:hypothetical protein
VSLILASIVVRLKWPRCDNHRDRVYPPFRGWTDGARHHTSSATLVELVVTSRVIRSQPSVVVSRRRAEAIPLENDNWIWAVIFTTMALAALSVAVVFSVAAG